MLKSFNPGHVLLLVLLAGVSGLAADKSPQLKTAKPAASALSKQQKHALWMLDQLFEASRQSQNQAFRIEAEAAIADVLWQHDRERARIYFTHAFRSIASISQEEQDPAQPSGGQPLASIKAGLRRRLAAMIARRDPALAEALVNELSRSADHEDASALYPELAANSAATDTRRAVEMIKATLGSGITPDLISSLKSIRAVQPQSADNLFYDSLARAARDGDKFGEDLGVLAPYVFGPGRGAAATAGGGAAPPAPPAQGGEAQLIRNFLDFAFQTTSDISGQKSAGSPAGLIPYAQLMQFLPYYQQYFPQKASRISAAFNQLVASNPDPIKQSLLVNLFTQPPAGKIVKAADSLIDPEQKDLFYKVAALQASHDGHFEQALTISRLIGDRTARQMVESIVNQNAALRALDRQDIDAACKYAAEIPNLPQQSRVYAQIIRALTAKKEMVRAGEVLDNAERQLLKAEEGPEKARALLLLSTVALPVDQIRATAILQLAVVAINHADAPDAARNAHASVASVREDAATVLNSHSFDFQLTFGMLARLDFDTAFSLAQSIAPREISLLAQIAACQGALLGTKGNKTKHGAGSAGKRPSRNQNSPVT